MTQLWRRILFTSSLLSLLVSPFVSADVNPNGAVGSCPYSQVFLTSFAFKVTPTGSTSSIDLAPLLQPAFNSAGGPFQYVIERGSDLPTGTLSFTPLGLTDLATFRIRFNGGAYFYAAVGEEVTADLVAGTDLVEFDVIQAPCAGSDIQEYAITIYQNGSSIIPPPTGAFVESSTAAAPPTGAFVESSTAAAPTPTPCTTPSQSVFLDSFDLTITPTGSSTPIDITSLVTPTYNSAGPFFYVIERGSDLPTGTLTFTPTSFSAGATFRISFNQGTYVFATEGQAVSASLVAGTDLIQFDVIQNPSCGNVIQEYSITLYQNGSSILTPPPAQGGSNSTTPPPQGESNSTTSTPTTTCQYPGQVFLNEFSLFITPSGSSGSIDFTPYITPAFNPAGPFFYVIERGSDLATGTITFTPISFSAGATFDIRFNQINTDNTGYTFPTEGEAVTGALIAGTNLIQFDVIQNPNCGKDIQEYSITLYQNGTSKVPAPPVVIAPSSTASAPAPPVVPPQGGSVATTPPAVTTPVVVNGCPAVNFTYSVAPNANGGLLITWTNTDTDASIGWVDFHVSINAALVAGSASVDAPQYNYRMVQSTSKQDVFTLNFPTGTDDVTWDSTQYINFFFTYCSAVTGSQPVDCNTDVFNYNNQAPPSTGALVVGPSGICPAVNFTQFVTTSGSSGSETFTFAWYSTTPGVTIGWVDIHVTITSSTVNGQFNYRLFESAITSAQRSQFTGYVPDNLFYFTMPGIDGVTIPQDASVSYFFTYCADHTDCNTENFNFSPTTTPGQGGFVEGGAGVCPAITYNATFTRDTSNPNILTVTFTNQSPKTVMWVDLHVTINTVLLADGNGAYSPQFNYRMTQQSADVFTYTFPGLDGVSVPQSSYLDYFFTYCAESVDCNTPPATFGATSAVTASTSALYQLNSNSNANTNTNGGFKLAADGLLLTFLALLSAFLMAA